MDCCVEGHCELVHDHVHDFDLELVHDPDFDHDHGPDHDIQLDLDLEFDLDHGGSWTAA